MLSGLHGLILNQLMDSLLYGWFVGCSYISLLLKAEHGRWWAQIRFELLGNWDLISQQDTQDKEHCTRELYIHEFIGDSVASLIGGCLL